MWYGIVDKAVYRSSPLIDVDEIALVVLYSDTVRRIAGTSSRRTIYDSRNNEPEKKE